jgi:two-component system, LuxR family, sensor kinase FixL
MNDNQEIERLQAIIDSAIDGIITINELGIIESANPAAARIFGYSGNELVGKNVNILMPEPDHGAHDLYLKNYHTTSIRKIIGIGREVTGKKKNGELFPIQLGISEIKLDNKTIYSGIIHDLTRIKDTENALSESENRINAIINSAVDGIISITERGIILSVNPSAAKIFEYSESELLGKTINMLMPEPDRSYHDQYMENYHRTGVKKIIGIGREVIGLKRSGSVFPFFLSVSEVYISGNRIYTGFVHDITEQKLNEEKLKRYAEDLERSNQELQNFAYVSSHDLQEPLRKIQAFGDRLKMKEFEKLSDQGKDYIDRMLNASFRMQNLINDLLTFSRVTSKAKPFEKVDLNQILNDVLNDLEILTEKSGALIEAEQLPVIEADSTQMRQLFQNLISNAIKFKKEDEAPQINISFQRFSPSGGVGIEDEDFIELYIRDNGIGFDEKYLDKIFNIFQRLEGRKYEGSGIGLSICRKIAIRHGGHISAKSEIGKGSIFIVKLATKQS